ncbi:hypothetical protein PM082_012263 [Marasmius tenuissimus]|nr:hypothetical protein PM082_012263 [Marasmius tenuissimus]
MLMAESSRSRKLERLCVCRISGSEARGKGQLASDKALGRLESEQQSVFVRLKLCFASTVGVTDSYRYPPHFGKRRLIRVSIDPAANADNIIPAIVPPAFLVLTGSSRSTGSTTKRVKSRDRYEPTAIGASGEVKSVTSGT